MFSRMLSDICAHMRARPDAIALLTPQGALSFGALGAMVQGIIDRLEPEGNDCLLVMGHKEAEVVAAMLACCFTGRPFVFVDRSNPAARVARIAAIARPALALVAGVQRDTDDALPQIDLTGITSRALQPDCLTECDDNGLFYIIFTSGSTGEPKGVPITRANFAAFYGWYGPMLANESTMGAHVNHANLAFDMGMLDLWPTLALGRAVILLDHANNIIPRNNLRQLLSNPSVSAGSWFSTPSLLQLMCTEAQFCEAQLPDLRCFFFGGELVPRSLVRDLMRRFPSARMQHAYGPSEVTCVTHVYSLNASEVDGEGPLPLGPALAPTTMHVLDEDGQPVATGDLGEVYLVGPQVVSGYLPASNPANAAFSQRDGIAMYRTGDLGVVDNNGGLTLFGRADRQVKWNGNRIELDEIERVTHAVAQVQKAACLAQREDGRVVGIILFVQLRSGVSMDRGELMELLGRSLPVAMVPRDLRFVSSLPVTLNGKLDSRALLAGAGNPSDRAEPRNAAEACAAS
ncbi:MAG: AMP-binding protein [Paracoccaceae bacterium]